MQEIAKFQDQEPSIASDTFSSTFHSLMDLIITRCGNVSSIVDLDLSSLTRASELMDKYHVIEIEEDSDEAPIATGYTKNHTLAPVILVSYW